MREYVTKYKPRDLNDFEEFTFEEAYKLIEIYAKQLWGTYISLHKIMTVEDVIQDIATSVWQRKAIERYNSNITSKRYFIMIIVKRWYIDLIKKRRVDFQSLDRDINDTEECSMLDLFGTEENKDFYISLEELLNTVSNETDSRVMGIVPGIGETKMTERVLVSLYLDGYTPTAISKYFINPSSGRCISPGRVAQILESALEKLRCNYNIYF